MRGKTCTGTCQPSLIHTNLHAAWDVALIDKTVWNWGAYVERLETGWLRSDEANGVEAGTPLDWAWESDAAARLVWNAVPPRSVLEDSYYNQILPVLDRQLGRAGLCLARFLKEG